MCRSMTERLEMQCLFGFTPSDAHVEAVAVVGPCRRDQRRAVQDGASPKRSNSFAVVGRCQIFGQKAGGADIVNL